MFRIKTDIRQFNCETSEKVEKLIRSWVIRPTDLMLDEAQQTWSPIGEHEDFAPVFMQLREGSDVDPSEPEVVTGSEPAARAQILSGHGMLKLRALEHEESEPLPIPVAPEGVEPAVAADEPTIMTERTADLLGVLDEEIAGQSAAEEDSEASAAPLPVPVAPEGVEPAVVSEEATQIFERDEEEEAGDVEASYELEELSSPSSDTPPEAKKDEGEPGAEEAPRLGRHDLPEELFLTNEISRSELIAPLEPMMDDLRHSSVTDDEDTEAWEVTRQVESALDEGSQDEDPLPLPDELEDGGLDIALSEAAESDIHSEWENMMELDEWRDTGEFSLDDHGDMLVPVALDESEEDIRETLEIDSPLVVASEPQVDQPAGISDKIIVEEDEDILLGLDDTADFRVDEIFSSATAPPPALEEPSEDSSPSEPSTQEESSSPDDELSAVVGASHEVIAEPEHDITEVPVEEIKDPFFEGEDFVSEGYAMALPFEITPSASDMSQGVRRSTASEDEKDAIFPRPRPKKLGELSTHRYGYGDTPRVQSSGSSEPRHHEAPPRDYSRMAAVLALIFVVLMIASLIIIFD